MGKYFHYSKAHIICCHVTTSFTFLDFITTKEESQKGNSHYLNLTVFTNILIEELPFIAHSLCHTHLIQCHLSYFSGYFSILQSTRIQLQCKCKIFNTEIQWTANSRDLPSHPLNHSNTSTLACAHTSLILCKLTLNKHRKLTLKFAGKLQFK